MARSESCGKKQGREMGRVIECGFFLVWHSVEVLGISISPSSGKRHDLDQGRQNGQ
jgi:hypothetical protein